jgi:Tannase and feruloyl esterase
VKSRLIARALIVAAGLCGAHQVSAFDAAAACTGIAHTGLGLLDNGMVTGAVMVRNGKVETFNSLPAFCRVSMTLHAAPKSSIDAELWLPAHWNGRYLQAGNGGFAGSIAYAGLAAGVRNGFAVANSDGGHHSVGGDATWGMNDPDKLSDFGNRAILQTALASKRVVAAFYGAPAKRAYFSGCSDGGRESLMAAQRYPEQFDGFLVGAPENDFTGELTTELFLSQASAPLPQPLLPAQLQLAQAAELAACDGADGMVDGLASRPRSCPHTLHALVCQEGAASTCLTASQVNAMTRIDAGWRDAKRGLYFPGLGDAIGTEAEHGQWATWLSGFGAEPGWHEAYAQQFFEYVVYAKPGLDIRTLDVGDAYQAAVARVGQAVDANDPDLSRVRSAGKKIIQFHGWSDVGIPTEYSLAYYRAVQTRMGVGAGGAGDVSDFYRLFLAPGMGHCGGGPGPNSFGQSADSETPFEPRRHLLAALVQWVEQGKPPQSVIATKRLGDAPGGKVLRTRPLCPFPQEARYRGQGSIDDAGSFQCH